MPAHRNVPISKIIAYIKRVDVDSVIEGQNEQQHAHGVPHNRHFNLNIK